MNGTRAALAAMLCTGLLALAVLPACGILQRPAGVHAFELDADDFFFETAELAVGAGDTVTIRLRNIGVTPHNFVSDEVVTSPVIEPGQTTTFEFEAPAAGTYAFYCSVPGHRELGMVGTLTVRD